MKTMRLGVVLICFLVLQVFLSYVLPFGAQAAGSPDVFVGVHIGYGDVAEAKALIDQVSTYTNFLVIGSSAITGNLTKLNETCQYAYDKGLSFICLCPNLGRANRTGWLEFAKQTWADRFLGFYAYDEPAGRQLDLNESRVGDTTPSSYTDAAYLFESNMSSQLNSLKNYFSSMHCQLFTSDYALYWFDYKAGYDALFAELGWNYSKQLNVALCRGAATVQNKDWGAIILWTYTTPPYIESGAELYKDLILAYDNGAKYILVFDSNDNYTQGILKEEHLQALQQFWQYARDNPRKSNPVSARVAYVLPNGYGFGFRGPNDRIWGIWEADALSYNVSISVNSLLDEYGTKLDIIYDEGLLPGNMYGYSKLIYWNDPSLSLYTSPTPSPSTSPTSSPTPTQTPAPTPIESSPSLMNYILAIVAGAVIAVVAVPALVLRKRQYHITFAQTGVGTDFTGTMVVIDGESYDRYGTSFWWNQGSRHTFEFASPITVSHGKQYVWTSTTGLATDRNGILVVSMPSTVTGNYRPVFKIGMSLPTVVNHRLRYAKSA
jgi:hypothetical protein